MRRNPSAPGGDPDMPSKPETLGRIIAVTLLTVSACAALAGPMAGVLVAVWEWLT